jgi:hypothetical protein
MANEITLNVRLDYASGSIRDGIIGADALSVDLATQVLLHNTQIVGTSEEALLLGDVTAGHWLIAVNRSASGTISIRAATGETNLVDLDPGEPACFRLAAAATAPFVIASVEATLEYLVFTDA